MNDRQRFERQKHLSNRHYSVSKKIHFDQRTLAWHYGDCFKTLRTLFIERITEKRNESAICQNSPLVRPWKPKVHVWNRAIEPYRNIHGLLLLHSTLSRGLCGPRGQGKASFNGLACHDFLHWYSTKLCTYEAGQVFKAMKRGKSLMFSWLLVFFYYFPGPSFFIAWLIACVDDRDTNDRDNCRSAGRFHFWGHLK